MSDRGPIRRPPPSRGLSLTRRLAITGGSGLATLGVFLMLVALAAVWLYQGPGPAAHNGGPTNVILRPGASLPEIASTLKRDHAIGSSTIFIITANVSGAARHLKAGEYAFAPHASMATVMGMIRRGEFVHHMLTIPEGLTSEAAVDLLANSDILTGSAPIPPEGAILPETYEVRRGEDRAAVLQRMMDARDQLLAGLWAQRRPDTPLATPEDAVILASIVEKETALASERPRVAAVFENRLQKGMKLESDPTVIFGVSRGVPLGRGLLESELKEATPYNTYVITGLPPTPICNPGRASLAAVLDAPRTDELYFVANGSGGHNFSSTLEQHEKNVAQWRAIEHAGKPPAAAGRRRERTEVALSGMTGFARVDGAVGGWTWTLEARSVNGRSLETRFRGPGGFDGLERAARDGAQARFQRGQLNVTLQARRAGEEGGVRINAEQIERYLEFCRPYVESGRASPPSFDSLLGLPGVIDSNSEVDDPEALAAAEAAMAGAIGDSLDRLRAARLEEGAALAPVLSGLIDRIEALVAAAEVEAQAQPALLKERFAKRIAELVDRGGDLNERIVQEAAVMAGRADVREELDRLTSHVQAARTLLSADGSVGRRLDFLTQEFMREANTLCSKSATTALTGIGLELKATVDQLREQVQNVE